MQRSISVLLATAMAATTIAASFVPAQAAMPAPAPTVADGNGATAIIPVENNRESQWWFPPQNRGGNRGHHNGWNNNNGWNNDNNWNWNGRRHHRRHWRGWDDDDHGAALALGLFGFAAGAMLGSQAYGGGSYGGSCGVYDRHDAACDDRFRSYDWCSNTYMGYDGDRHYC